MNNSVGQRTFLNGIVAATVATTVVFSGAYSLPLFAQEGSTLQVEKEHIVKIDEMGPRMGIKEFEWSSGYIEEDELLANALGLTMDELQPTYEKAFEIALVQAVTDGELTQAQADELLSDEDGIYMVDALVTEEQMTQYLAQALDLSQEEFDTALDGAIQQAADDGLITQAQANDMLLGKLIEEKMDEAFGQALDEGVSQGLITKKQAEQMREDSMGGFAHEEEVIFMDPFSRGGHHGDAPRGSLGFFGIECGPDGMDEEIFEFHGSGGFGRHFEDRISDLEFFFEQGR